MSEIAAHITGTVFQVLVAVGDEVGLEDEVVVLESMKMELPVESEVTGTVAEVLCAPGDPVEAGQVLIRLG
jgi:acetyl-CoA carboxylase biotin carboxyl carrier protein